MSNQYLNEEVKSGFQKWFAPKHKLIPVRDIGIIEVFDESTVKPYELNGFKYKPNIIKRIYYWFTNKYNNSPYRKQRNMSAKTRKFNRTLMIDVPLKADVQELTLTKDKISELKSNE